MKDKSITPEGVANSAPELNFNIPIIKRDTKMFGVLSAFAEGRSLNRFDAIRSLNETCLNSTISKIEELGIQIRRKFETVPCVNGTKTTEVKRYWLDDFNLLKAQKITEAAK